MGRDKKLEELERKVKKLEAKVKQLEKKTDDSKASRVADWICLILEIVGSTIVLITALLG